MKLPTLDNLNHVTGLVYGHKFDLLDDTRKLHIIAIAQEGVLADVMHNMATNIANDIVIALAETLAEQQPLQPLIDQLKEIDKSLGWLDKISEWFDKSKLWEGEAYVRQ